jgi:hypothetical protein
MTSLLASTALAVALGSSAAMAVPFQPFGTAGQAGTTETSYESLVTKVGQTLQGIFKVTSIDAGSGNTFTSGVTGAPTYITGAFTGFTLAHIDVISATSTKLYFTGGQLNYYSNNTNLFATQLHNLLQLPATTTNENNAVSILAAGTNILSANAESIYDGGLSIPYVGTTLEIDLNGSVTGFTKAATSAVYLDIIGGSMAGIFDNSAFINSFTGQLAGGIYQGHANGALGTGGSQCLPSQPEWQVCGSNTATFSVVPEPITLSVFGAGLAGAAAIRRRKAKKAA